MPLTVFTGGVRSGKSSAASAYAASTGLRVAVAAAGVDSGDEEMRRRIEAHRRSRPPEWKVLEVAGLEPEGWLAEVSLGECLLVDCLGTVLAGLLWPSRGFDDVVLDVETATKTALALAEALITRSGETIVVTNEVGWGVVPASASGRVFRDALGAANRVLVDAADRAYLVVCGRLLDLTAMPSVADMERRHEG